MHDDALKTNKRTPVAQHEERPACYGDADLVCPRDNRGFTTPQLECLTCGHLKSCLQKGLSSQGVIPPPLMESAAVSRVTGFLKRWSRQKLQGSTVPPDPD